MCVRGVCVYIIIVCVCVFTLCVCVWYRWVIRRDDCIVVCWKGPTESLQRNIPTAHAHLAVTHLQVSTTATRMFKRAESQPWRGDSTITTPKPGETISWKALVPQCIIHCLCDYCMVLAENQDISTSGCEASNPDTYSVVDIITDTCCESSNANSHQGRSYKLLVAPEVACPNCQPETLVN